MAAAGRRWPIWKVSYFALMGALGLIALLIVVLGVELFFGGGNFLW